MAGGRDTAKDRVRQLMAGEYVRASDRPGTINHMERLIDNEIALMYPGKPNRRQRRLVKKQIMAKLRRK